MERTGGLEPLVSALATPCSAFELCPQLVDRLRIELSAAILQGSSAPQCPAPIHKPKLPIPSLGVRAGASTDIPGKTKNPSQGCAWRGWMAKAMFEVLTPRLSLQRTRIACSAWSPSAYTRARTRRIDPTDFVRRVFWRVYGPTLESWRRI